MKVSFYIFPLALLIGAYPNCYTKTALITGINGQDGSYLAELLLEKNYTVHGIVRRSSTHNTVYLDHLYQKYNTSDQEQFVLHYGDLTDANNISEIIRKILPDEIYNLAAQCHVQVSFELPKYTTEVDALGVLHILEAIHALREIKNIKFYQASTSELYGAALESPQTEQTPFYPKSPYGVAKLYGFWITKNYRESYNLFAVNGIAFNHESPRRGENFVSMKIVKAAVRIAKGSNETLYLGNLNAERDFGHAKDYVEGMWLMLQQETPCDLVLATGEKHSVRQFVTEAFKQVGITLQWQGIGLNEVGIDTQTNKIIVRINPSLFRPAEVNQVIGNASKARSLLGWTPKYSFEQLIHDMVQSEMQNQSLDTKN